MPGTPSSSSFIRIPRSLQELPPPQARFCLEVGRFLTLSLGVRLDGSRILVGLSGGADSTALLLCLHYISAKYSFSLHVAHLDHALRPSSAGEAEHCRELCEWLAIPFTSVRLDINAMSREEKIGIEECARKARYTFFSSVAEAEGCDRTATGHTQNDLAEDQLMRLIRGTGWPGLGGMRAHDEGRRLLRPLLMTSRREIESFLTDLKAPWLEDESNGDLAYFRNRVRMQLLPFILRENPSFLENAAGIWKLARVDEDFFTQAIPAPIRTTLSENDARSNNWESGMEGLKSMPQALRLRHYKTALATLGGGQALLDGLFKLDRSVMAAASGTMREGERTHQFPGGNEARVSRKGILWQKTLPES